MKLHEAMFDMKEQLQLMESQLASIAKQKQSLERTLEAKTKYIRVSLRHMNFVCDTTYIATLELHMYYLTYSFHDV